MNRRRKVGNVFIWLSVFVSFLIPIEVKAFDSTLIEKTDQAYVFVDNESINHISTNIFKAQVKYFLYTVETFKSKYINFYLSDYEFDCDEKRIKVLQKVFYYTDYTSDMDDREHSWSYIAPDTVESVLFKYVCKYNNHTNPSSNKQEVEEKSSNSIKPLGSKLTVQAGAFKDITRAKDLIKSLSQKGHRVYMSISEPMNNSLYKVFIGEFSDREKAEHLSEVINNTENLDSFVTSR